MSINPFPNTEIEQLLKKSEFILETGTMFLEDSLKKRGFLNDAFLPLLNKALEANELDSPEKIKFFIEGALPDAKDEEDVFKSVQELTTTSLTHHQLALIERYEKLIAQQKEDPTQLTLQEVDDLTAGSDFLDQVQKAVAHLSVKTPIDAINKSYDELSALKKTKDEALQKAKEEEEAKKGAEEKGAEEKEEHDPAKESLINDSHFKEKAEAIDWLKFRQEVIWKQLDKITGQPTHEMGMALVMTVALDVPTAILEFFNKHFREARKKKAKKEKENRAEHIKASLNGRAKLTHNDLVSRLAIEAKQWIMDDSIVNKMPGKGAKLTPYQRAMFKKWLFSTTLPLTADFDLDFNRFTKAQKKQYQEYLKIYAHIEPWVSKSNKLCGVKLKGSERMKDAALAFSMNIKGGLDPEKMKARNTFFKSLVSPHRSWFRRKRKGFSLSRAA